MRNFRLVVYFCLLPLWIACGAIPGPSSVLAQQTAEPVGAVDPVTGVVHSRRLKTGVPLGGIGTGVVQLRTDGTVGNATYNNNHRAPILDMPGCFGAIWTRVGDRVESRVLALHSDYGLPTVKGLDYAGLFPQATMTFTDKAIPLSASLRAFSPLIPGDLKNSSLPGALFVYHLKNNSVNTVEVAVALAWENTLGVGEQPTGEPFHDRTGNTATIVPDSQGYFGMRFASPISGSSNGARANAGGEMVLMARPPRPTAVATVAGWDAHGARPGWWDHFAVDGTVSGESPVGAEEGAHPAGVVTVRLTLKPRDSVEIPFAVAWYNEHAWTPVGTDEGHLYQLAYPDAYHVGQSLISNWRSSLALTEDWQQRILFSNLPAGVARRLINSVAPLTAYSVLTRAGRFRLREKPVESGITDTATMSPETNAVGRAASTSVVLSFFPRLEAQLLDQRAIALAPMGPPAPTTSDEVQTADSTGDFTPPDTSVPVQPPSAGAASSFLLQMAQYVLWTGDRDFLIQRMGGVSAAMKMVLAKFGADGTPDTTATKVPPTSGEASLWLAALYAGQRLAEIQGDTALNGAWKSAMARASTRFDATFWNGHFYASKGSGVSNTDQLLGVWAADSLELGPLVPEDHLRTALASLQRVNDAAGGLLPGPARHQTESGAPATADPDGEGCDLLASTLGEAALYIAHGNPTAGLDLFQRLETGRENILLSPWLTPPLASGEPGTQDTAAEESFDMADWNILAAVEGLHIDLIRGRLTLLPALPGAWRRLNAPVFAPTFWGNMQYKPTAHGGIHIFRLDRLIALVAVKPTIKSTGSAGLTLKSIRIPGPDEASGSAPVHAHVSLGQAPIGCRTEALPSGELILTFDSPLTLATGDRLEVDIH